MSDGKIHCRTKASAGCYDGKSEVAVYGDGGMEEDSTFDGRTVCCDACYIAIGQPSVPVESPEAATFPQTIGQPEPKQPSWSWTQPQCMNCWKLHNGERPPMQLKSPTAESCVTCGDTTHSGIYIRIDPKEARYPSIGKDE
jgi:hypothetical protein